jgi:hypothetical protein
MWGSSRASRTYCCIPCRRVSKAEIWSKNAGMSSYICPKCRLPMKSMGTRWSPPKKNNYGAWRAIANGDFLWDKKRVDNRAKRDKLRRLSIREHFIVERSAELRKERKRKGLPWSKGRS